MLRKIISIKKSQKKNKSKNTNNAKMHTNLQKNVPKS